MTRYRLEQRRAAGGVERHVAVVARHGGDADDLGNLLQHRIALVERIRQRRGRGAGGRSRGLDRIVRLLELLQQTVQRVDVRADFLVGVGAYSVDGRGGVVQRICKVLGGVDGRLRRGGAGRRTGIGLHCRLQGGKIGGRRDLVIVAADRSGLNILVTLQQTLLRGIVRRAAQE